MTGKGRYGKICLKQKTVQAHRIAYALANDLNFPITGARMSSVLDHLCRVKNCVNSKHLELVSHRENICRGDTCRNKKLTVGVSWDKEEKAYQAGITLPGTSSRINLGRYDSAIIAASIYQVARGAIEMGKAKTRADLVKI